MKVKTLTHNGILFPPEYERCGSKLTANFNSLAEEMLWHWSAKRDTDYVKDKVIIKNFWRCLKPELPKEWQSKKFPQDFSAIIDDLFSINQVKKAEKAAYRKEHKKEIEAEKAAQKEKYGYAMVNGKKQQRDAYLVEGPGIMLARGASPIKGCWKYRTQPEDIIINYIGPKGSEPKAPEGHHWKEVVHNHNAFLTYHYYVKVGDMTERIKRGRFAAASEINKKADENKYIKAQKLAQDYDEIMEQFERDAVNADNLITKEAALISYLISVTAIRIGNEKDKKTEAMTVGMSTLLADNMSLEVRED